MSSVFRDPSAGWAAALIVVLPLLIIGIGEIEERLRQRDSMLRPSISILRTWVVPLFAVWTVSRALFDAPDDSFFVQLLGSALVLSVAAAALAALRVLVERLRTRPRGEGRRAVPRLLLAMPRLLIILTTIWLLVAGVWSVDLSAALTALGVTSLVVSFALQDTLGGIASGFTLLADQPFQPGDWIRTGEIEGRVLDVNWRSSRIQNRDGDLVVVPNGQLATATIVNFDEPSRNHRVVVSLQVAYSNAPTSAIEMLLAAARATPGVLAEPPPNVMVTQIDDPLMGYDVQMWIDDYAIAPTVESQFGALVWYHSHRFDVPLPSPAQDLYLWDGVKVALEGRPDPAALRRGLRRSPLLEQVGDDEIDQLLSVAVSAQYSRGETITIEGSGQDLEILDRGEARVVVRGGAGGDTPVVDLEPGDLFGVVDHAPTGKYRPVVVAVSDCVIIRVPAAVAGTVISRSPDLTAALEQLGDSRRRRVARVTRRLVEAEAADALAAAVEGDVTIESSRAEPASDEGEPHADPNGAPT